jgi:hypothetical protein
MSTQWTWALDMAGDNDLNDVLFAEFGKFASVGARLQGTAVAMVGQLDLTNRNTMRWQVTRDGIRNVQQLPNVNSGDPDALADFLTWVKSNFPSRYYAVILASHGRGWMDFDFPDAGGNGNGNGQRNGVGRTFTERRGIPFRSVVSEMQNEAIVVDAAARDYLTNSELVTALKKAQGSDGKFAIIGCDACLMAMIEIGYELADCAEVLVAAQDNELPGGWPHDEIVPQFNSAPLTPDAAARIIIDEARRFNPPVKTISAVRLSKAEDVVSALDTLGKALLPAMNGQFAAIDRARNAVKYFAITSYIDLRDFAEKLQIEFDRSSAVWKAAQGVIDAVDAAVIAPAKSSVTDRAYGISVYLPTLEFDPDVNRYSELRLAQKATYWRDFVVAFAKKA